MRRGSGKVTSDERGENEWKAAVRKTGGEGTQAKERATEGERRLEDELRIFLRVCSGLGAFLALDIRGCG